MATFNLQQFISTISSSGLAKENRFEVILPEAISDAPVSLFCESVSLPQMSVMMKQQRLFGPTYNRAATVDYGGAGIQLTFYVDSDMKVKKYFDSWMHMCVAPSTFSARYLKDYAFNVDIYQLNEKDERTYHIRLIEAFPTSSGPMTLNQSSIDSAHRLPVTLSYRYWETDDINNSTPVFPEEISSLTGDNPKTITLQEKLTPQTPPNANANNPGMRGTAADYFADRVSKRPGEGF
jgi:hypothetical protein